VLYGSEAACQAEAKAGTRKGVSAPRTDEFTRDAPFFRTDILCSQHSLHFSVKLTIPVHESRHVDNSISIQSFFFGIN
jgi:hypothetical protein